MPIPHRAFALLAILGMGCSAASNSGIDSPPSDKPPIFKKFRRLTPSQN